jgi:hypothetical protein
MIDPTSTVNRTTLGGEVSSGDFLIEQHPSKEDVGNMKVSGREDIKHAFVFAMGKEKLFRYDKNTKVENRANPGNISFKDLRKWEELYSKDKRKYLLEFRQQEQ